MLVRVSGVLSSTSLGGERLRLRGHSAAGGMKLKAWSSYAEVCKRLGPQNDMRDVEGSRHHAISTKRFENQSLSAISLHFAFSHCSAVTPIGAAVRLPIIISHKVVELGDAGLFFLGAGETDLKVGAALACWVLSLSSRHASQPFSCTLLYYKCLQRALSGSPS